MFAPNEILDIRKTALAQAAHDFRGNEQAEIVVERAATYAEFLAEGLKKPEAVSNPADDRDALFAMEMAYIEAVSNELPNWAVKAVDASPGEVAIMIYVAEPGENRRKSISFPASSPPAPAALAKAFRQWVDEVTA